jgi:hypothetical protein
MKSVISVLMLSTLIISTPVLARDDHWRHGHHGHHHGHHKHHRSSNNDAALLVGGLLLGAAVASMADSPRTTYTTSSSTRYYSDYPTQVTSTTRYYTEEPRSYYPEPRNYYRDKYVTRERVVYTTERRHSRPRYDRVTEDVNGNCYDVNYRDGRRILKEIPRYNCQAY